MRSGDQAIRWTTTLSVVVLAGITAVLSYKHMYVLVRRYGETSWTAALLPVSVDGMIATSSMTLLADARNGQPGGQHRRRRAISGWPTDRRLALGRPDWLV